MQGKLVILLFLFLKNLLGFQLPTDNPSWVPITDRAFFKYCLRCQRSRNWAGILSSKCRSGTRSSGLSLSPTSNIKEDWEELAISGEFYVPALSHSHGLTARSRRAAGSQGLCALPELPGITLSDGRCGVRVTTRKATAGEKGQAQHKFPVLKGSETAFKTHL